VLRYLVDENFNQKIVRGLLRRLPELDIAIAQAIGLGGVSDSEVLDRAADEGRVVPTHDVRTLVPEAYARVAAGRAMPGVVASDDEIPIGPAIDDLILIHQATGDGSFEGQVVFSRFDSFARGDRTGNGRTVSALSCRTSPSGYNWPRPETAGSLPRGTSRSRPRRQHGRGA